MAKDLEPKLLQKIEEMRSNSLISGTKSL